jgi:hypothetical protein
VALKPVYAMFEAIPSTRESAQRLGLVTLQEMVNALAWAVENPPETLRIMPVPAIRAQINALASPAEPVERSDRPADHLGQSDGRPDAAH